MHPTILGSITTRTTPLYTSAMYRHYFDLIIFENIPANVLNTNDNITAMAGNLLLIMSANGRVYFRSGAIGQDRVPNLIKIFKLYNFVVQEKFVLGTSTKILDQLGIDTIPPDMTRNLDLDVDDDPVFLEFRRGGGRILSAESPI